MPHNDDAGVLVVGTTLKKKKKKKQCRLEQVPLGGLDRCSSGSAGSS